jgi:NAD+ diphosphatase
MSDAVRDTPIAFAGSRLDRADAVRSDPDALARLMDWRTRLLLLDGLDPVLTPEGTLAWGSLADARDAAELVFLGLDEGAAPRGHFAAVPREVPAAMQHAGPRSWEAMAVLSADELATYGGARAMVGWHARHRFCARCGHATHLAKGGWQRTCDNPACRAEHFPRVDPVTIMLVEHEDRLLLGRQPRFPAGRYSALAGFIEPGESIEEAVAREVHEEAGVRVRNVRYVASQPWPFPSSLMIGCHALAEDPAITIDRTELEDARWFSRAEVSDAMDAVAGGWEDAEQTTAFVAPPATAVAHHLLRWWLDHRPDA